MFGTSMDRWLDKEGFEDSSSRPKSTEVLFKQLDAGRIDLALSNINMFKSTIAPDERAKYKSIFVTDRFLGAYFGKQFLTVNSDFLRRFNVAIETCKANSNGLE